MPYATPRATRTAWTATEAWSRPQGRSGRAWRAFRLRLPDILAKARCRARLDPLPEAEEQVRGSINGYADLDDMSVALAVAVMKLAEGTLCA